MPKPPELMDLSDQIVEEPEIEKKDRFERLVEADDDEWDELEDPYHLQLTGYLYNISEDFGRMEGLNRVIELNQRLRERDLSEVHMAQRYYQLANAYSLRNGLDNQTDSRFTFFDSGDLINAIAYSRASLAMEDLSSVETRRIIQSFINFANALSQSGRMSEALLWYNRAVEASPEFGMALGNRGQAKMEYAALLFTEGHDALFLRSAYEDLEKGLENSEDLYPGAENVFIQLRDNAEAYSDERISVEALDENSLGEAGQDEECHRWVLENRLYLNPLNDISLHSATAHDYFHLPNMLIPEKDDFPYPGIYNQMKQEYVSARYLYYEGISSEDEEGHFSDRGVKLPDTLDYAVHGYRTEQVKTALRLSYSIFDKIANLINHYFGVGQREPGFNEVWHQGGDYKQGLADPFKNTNNWPLNALYWIKKDFHHSISERDEDSVVIVAHELRRFRRAIEHGYIKVYHDDIVSSPPERDLSGYRDTLYDAIGKQELRTSALEMLRLARAALFYTSFAIHYEERRKRQEIGGPALPMGGGVNIPDHLKE